MIRRPLCALRPIGIAIGTAVGLLSVPTFAQPPGGPQAEWSDPRGPVIIAGERDGQCLIFWSGRPLTEPELLARGASFIRNAVRRVGGPANVTTENFPPANLRIGDDVRYRCVSPVLKTLVASGFAEVRIENRDAIMAANPLVFWMDLYAKSEGNPPIDPVRNRVGLSSAGTLSWNGLPVDFITLRQYLDVTQTMNPQPLLTLDFHAEARFGVVRSALEVVWRTSLERVELVSVASPGRKSGDGIHLRPGRIIKRVTR